MVQAHTHTHISIYFYLALKRGGVESRRKALESSWLLFIHSHQEANQTVAPSQNRQPSGPEQHVAIKCVSVGIVDSVRVSQMKEWYSVKKKIN